MLTTTEKMEMVMERKAICDSETAAESAREGQDWTRLEPPSRETYITPFFPFPLLRPSRSLSLATMESNI